MDVIKNNNCSSYNIKENNHNKLKLKKQNCCVITCFIFYIFCISTINNLDKYLHLTTSRYILTYSNILYFISFLSLGVQVELLIGLRCGILPVDKYLKKIKKKLKDIDFFLVDLLMNELGFLLIFLNLSDSYYLKNSNTLVICLLRLVSFKILFNSAAHKFVHNSSQWLHLESFQNLFFCQPVPSILSHIANCKFDKKLICFLVIISENNAIINTQWNVYDFKCFHFVYYIYCLFCPLNICNSYAMLTYTRSHRGEIVIKELHKMGERYEWKPLYFKNKIDNLNKIGSVLWWGHLPRLEWKLHFFADYFKNENYEKNTYPIYICSFLKKLCMRQEHLASMIGEEQMRRVPLMIRLAYHDYKMSMTALAHNANDELTNTSILQDKKKWEFGKYWLRRQVGIIETLKLKRIKSSKLKE
ncbi:lipase maturation factor [Plasmodium brasilianum]|uniref:Lipase maturation factor n=1 Tax=Plasmodium brasilianum TaxID=5824 RepID=A0ACB9YE10_PLABR|nr:lipase maturation factor [Plasmodium brasilianum]